VLWDVFLNLNVQRLNELLCPTYLLCPFCGKQKIEKVIKVLVSRVIQSVRVRTSVRVPPPPLLRLEALSSVVNGPKHAQKPLYSA